MPSDGVEQLVQRLIVLNHIGVMLLLDRRLDLAVHPEKWERPSRVRLTPVARGPAPALRISADTQCTT